MIWHIKIKLDSDVGIELTVFPIGYRVWCPMWMEVNIWNYLELSGNCFVFCCLIGRLSLAHEWRS